MIPSLYTVQAGIGHGRDHFGGKDDSCVSNLTIYIQIFIFNFLSNCYNQSTFAHDATSQGI